MSRTLKTGKGSSLKCPRGKSYESYVLCFLSLPAPFLGKKYKILHPGDGMGVKIKYFKMKWAVLSFTFKMYMLDTNLIPKISNWNLYPSKRARWNSSFIFQDAVFFSKMLIGMFSPSIFLLFFFPVYPVFSW